MNRAYLSLGSNIGNREQYLAKARQMLNSGAGRIIRESSIYETEPWKMSDTGNFFNQVILLETEMKAPELLEHIISIEKSLGRTRKSGNYEPRTIDIDLLLYNDEVIKTPALTVPHPHMAERKFVLEPLCEIAADIIHPVLKKTVKQMLEECRDNHKVM